MNWWQATILGMVEGLTEFLPVSSTAHVTIASGLMGFDVSDRGITAFTAVVQFGAILAVLLYLRHDIARLARGWFRGLRHPEHRTDPDYRIAWLVIIGSVPLVVAGVVFEKLITGEFRSLWVVAFALILWGGVMWFAESTSTQHREQADMTLKDSLAIGFAQCLALIPGVSRSGSTISVGLLRGLNRVAATRLAFLLGLPAVIGAAVYELPTALSNDQGIDVPAGTLLAGTVVSFLVAYLSVAGMMKFVAKHKITVFVWYRWALGTVLIVALSAGWILPTGQLT